MRVLCSLVLVIERVFRCSWSCSLISLASFVFYSCVFCSLVLCFCFCFSVVLLIFVCCHCWLFLFVAVFVVLCSKFLVWCFLISFCFLFVIRVIVVCSLFWFFVLHFDRRHF